MYYSRGRWDDVKIRLNVTRAAHLSCLHVDRSHLIINGNSVGEAVRNCHQPHGIIEYCILAPSTTSSYHVEINRDSSIELRNYLAIYKENVYIIHQVTTDPSVNAEFTMTRHSQLNTPKTRRTIIEAARSLIAAQY